MILQALNDYYHRKQQASAGALPPQGFERIPISYLIVLGEDGSFVRFEPRYTIEKKRKYCHPFLLPQAVKRAAGIAANTLWDKAEYVLGVQAPVGKIEDAKKRVKAESDFQKKSERLPKQRAAFTKIVCDLDENCDEPALSAVAKFLRDLDVGSLANVEHFSDICLENPNMSFRLRNDENLVAEIPSIVENINNLRDDTLIGSATTMCLVSGKAAAPQRLHPAIKGVRGAQSAGGNIVSFNSDSFCSYGKRKQDPFNAPVRQ